MLYERGAMKFKAIFSLIMNGQFFLLLALLSRMKSFYKLCYIASAKTNGLCELLSTKPLSFNQLAKYYCKSQETNDAFEAWMQLGVRLKLLKFDMKGYSLTREGRKLALSRNDALIALAQEATLLHYNLIFKTPEKIKDGLLWNLDEQYGEIVARSSRSLEPFQTEAIDKTFTFSKPIRLLEIGCGSAFYIKYAAQKNPSLSAVGVELQQEVADMARQNIRSWGLQDRVEIETCDIREKEPNEFFDFVTLYNNIYYIPFNERVSFLSHVKKFIKPDGTLLLTTSCQGGSLGIELLNLYGAATAGCGKLASVDEMVGQLNEAGYKRVQANSLIFGDKFYAFKALNSYS
jgi:ubiquinone/menaquinone biosynthesis C-methylase UbiE